MTKYIVRRPEVHYQELIVEAESEEDALERAADDQGHETECLFYFQTFKPSEFEWEVEAVE